MAFVKLLEDMAGMIPINTHLKVFLGFIGVFDIDFSFIVDIWHDVQNESGSTLSSISCQTFSVSPCSRDLLDLCPNLWHNNSKETLLLGICFCCFYFSLVFLPKMHFFTVRRAVISPRSVHYHWGKLCKTFTKKEGMSQIH